MRTAITLAISTMLLLACGGIQEDFTPTEQVTALSPDGYPAAMYEMDAGEGDVGQAKVWSRGAFRTKVNGEKRTVVHVGFEIDNQTKSPITLAADTLRIDSATTNEYAIRNIPPADIQGPLVVQPTGESDVEVLFVMPRGVSPQDVDAFRVKWQVENHEFTYTQRTPFLEVEPIYAGDYYYYTPFYDPFYYEPYIYRPGVVTHDYPYRTYRRL